MTYRESAKCPLCNGSADLNAAPCSCSAPPRRTAIADLQAQATKTLQTPVTSPKGRTNWGIFTSLDEVERIRAPNLQIGDMAYVINTEEMSAYVCYDIILPSTEDPRRTDVLRRLGTPHCGRWRLLDAEDRVQLP